MRKLRIKGRAVRGERVSTSLTMPPTKSTFLPSGPGDGDGERDAGATEEVEEVSREERGSRMGDLSTS